TIQARSQELVALLLLVFHVHVLSVDHTFIFLLTAAVAARSRTVTRTTRPSTRRRTLRLRRLVHLLSQLVRSLGEGLARLIHLRLVVRFQRLLGICQRVLYIATLRTGDLVPVLAQHFLDAVNHAVELVLGLDRLARRLVLGRVRVRFLGHALDFFLRQPGRRRNRNLLV